MLEGLFDADRWSTTFQNMGPFWEGFGVTLQVVVAGLLLSLVLGTLLGGMMATDYGGPINKAPTSAARWHW